jgi:hypothetical protein
MNLKVNMKNEDDIKIWKKERVLNYINRRWTREPLNQDDIEKWKDSIDEWVARLKKDNCPNDQIGTKRGLVKIWTGDISLFSTKEGIEKQLNNNDGYLYFIYKLDGELIIEPQHVI